ncbi:gametocyte-specific factor 1 [Opisthocomus hoazin]|uniref:gametocyte-specific factor 1 n=1 Tax=Opisthocomus hoazin TaxID=30419 RepID=UPI003F5291DF
MDPGALVPCPYDKSHLIRACRLPYHLVKCQQNNPRVARTLAVCPFNASHRVPQAQLQSHVASCPSKRQLSLSHEKDASLGNKMKQPEVPALWQGPPCQEDWEAEVEDMEEPLPFILSVNRNDLLLPCDNSAPAESTSSRRGGGAAEPPAADAQWQAGEEPREEPWTVVARPRRRQFLP